MENYICLDTFSLYYQKYVYIDTKQHLANNIFIKNKIPVKYKVEYDNDINDYIAVFCKIPKSYNEKFKGAMEQLSNNIIICGYSDYMEFCKELFEEVFKEE